MMQKLLMARFILIVLASSMMLPAQSGGSENSYIQQRLRNICEVEGIGQCYRKIISRFLNNTYLPELITVSSRSEISTINSISFLSVDDADVLGALSTVRNGKPIIVLSSGMAYAVHIIAYSAVLMATLNEDQGRYEKYLLEVVDRLNRNSNLGKQGKPLLPYPDYADYIGLSQDNVRRLLEKDPSIEGKVAYWYQAMMFLIVSHEIGHQLLGHLDAEHREDRKEVELAADRFASGALVKMGFSVYPASLIYVFFDAMEQRGLNSAIYPKPLCRIAAVFDESRKLRAKSDHPPRDDVNRIWNIVLDEPEEIKRYDAILSSSDCAGESKSRDKQCEDLNLVFESGRRGWIELRQSEDTPDTDLDEIRKWKGNPLSFDYCDIAEHAGDFELYCSFESSNEAVVRQKSMENRSGLDHCLDPSNWSTRVQTRVRKDGSEVQTRSYTNKTVNNSVDLHTTQKSTSGEYRFSLGVQVGK